MITPATSSGLQSADGVISNAPGRFRGLYLVAAAVTGTVTLYDNATAAAGLVVAIGSAVAGDTCVLEPAEGVVLNNGLFLDIGGVGATAVVLYDRG